MISLKVAERPLVRVFLEEKTHSLHSALIERTSVDVSVFELGPAETMQHAVLRK